MYKRKIIFIIVIPILAIFLVIGILINLILYKGNIMVFKEISAITNVNKALTLEKTGGTLELKEEDLNGIFDFYLTKNIKNSHIKGIYSTINKSEVEFYIPVSYKNINLLLYTKGKLYSQDKMINFQPTSFKVGRINLSVNFVMEKLQKYLKNENIIVNKTTLSVNNDLIPFEFTSLTMKGNIVEAQISKTVVPASIDNPSADKPTTQNNSPSTVVDQNKALLIKANSQLNRVYASVSTSTEKQIISNMIAVVGKMINNPNYPYKNEADQTKGNYNNLSQSEKDDLKNAMIDNMDMQTVKKLKATFGF